MIGRYHDLTPGRESLACDFAEPLRPAIDRFLLAPFAGGVLRPERFSQSGAHREFYASFDENVAPRHRPMLARMAAEFASALRAWAATTGAPAIAAPKTEPGYGG